MDFMVSTGTTLRVRVNRPKTEGPPGKWNPDSAPNAQLAYGFTYTGGELGVVVADDGGDLQVLSPKHYKVVRQGA